MVAFRVGETFWNLPQYRDLGLPRNGVLPTTILERQAVQFTLDHWMLWGLSVSVQSHNAMAVAYINQGGTKSQATQKLVSHILTEHNVLSLSAAHIPTDRWSFSITSCWFQGKGHFFLRCSLQFVSIGLHRTCVNWRPGSTTGSRRRYHQ